MRAQVEYLSFSSSNAVLRGVIENLDLSLKMEIKMASCASVHKSDQESFSFGQVILAHSKAIQCLGYCSLSERNIKSK